MVSMVFILAFCLLVADWTSDRHMHSRLPRKRATAGTIITPLKAFRRGARGKHNIDEQIDEQRKC